MFLMSLQQSFSTSYILGQFICCDDVLGVSDPTDQVTVVRQETVEVVAVIQTSLPVSGFLPQLSPGCLDVSLLITDLISLVTMDLTQTISLSCEVLYL